GALFAHYALLPTTLGFFLNFQKYFQDENIKTMISVSEYVGFVMLLTIVCGLIFEMPIVIVALALVGVVNSTMLRNGRRYAILIIFIVAAVATPTPDALTQTVVAIPMILLYEISILIVRGLGR
ncbi:MAG: twin-arginine translocase subunit TatC, partial [Armatimonadetes bacterium]|nr:twin-arginine translocase subunit TatC [Armatimonadota bacterium]